MASFVADVINTLKFTKNARY